MREDRLKMRRMSLWGWLRWSAALGGLLGALALAGCKTSDEAASLVANPASTAGTSTGAAVQTFLELLSPQSDDQGNYVPVVNSGSQPVMGYIAAASKIAGITVNDVPAAIYPATYTPWGAPSGLVELGFRALQYLEPGHPA